jgi:hypothetical protein
MPRRSHLSVEVLEEIERLVPFGRSPTTIHNYLRDQGFYQRQGWEPHLRTIQNKVKELSPPDPSGRWSFAKADPAEARLVLPVLAAVLEKTQGRLWLTEDAADWIVRIKTAAPTLPDDWWTYVYARTYQRDGEKAVWLDRFLAFRPWESNEAYERYQAVEASIATFQPWESNEAYRRVATLPEPIFVADEYKQDGDQP